jgi:hypothetical protein
MDIGVSSKMSASPNGANAGGTSVHLTPVTPTTCPMRTLRKYVPHCRVQLARSGSISSAAGSIERAGHSSQSTQGRQHTTRGLTLQPVVNNLLRLRRNGREIGFSLHIRRGTSS